MMKLDAVEKMGDNLKGIIIGFDAKVQMNLGCNYS